MSGDRRQLGARNPAPPPCGEPVRNKEESETGSETRKTEVSPQQSALKDLLETEMTKKDLGNSGKEPERHKR